MLANYHTHTFRCKHAKGEDREYVESAIRAGMKVLGFSDHCPWIFEDGFVSKVRMLPSNLDDYFDSMERLKKEYAREITIYAGFESEYLPELMSAQTELLKDYPVDYMILGQHFNSREPYSPYTGFPTDEEQTLKLYVDLVIEGLETGLYQYVAHPDILNYVGPSQIYEVHMERLCKYFKEKNYPIEINLLGFSENRIYPADRFLRIAQKVGNKAIIGVDAHSPGRLESIELQEECVRLAQQYSLPLIDFLPGLQ